MCVPVAGAEDFPFGVMEVGSIDPVAFVDRDLVFLSALLAQVSQRLQRATGLAPILRAEWLTRRSGPFPAASAI